MIEVSYMGNSLKIIEIEKRPWVSIAPFCRALGIEPRAQERRIERHRADAGLPVWVMEASSDGETETCLPLELLGWWLWTLRPRSADARRRLEAYRDGSALALLFYWVNAGGRFGTSEMVYQAQRAAPLPRSKPPVRRSKITVEQANAMRALKREQPELSFSEIGDRFEVSKGTAWKIICGHYQPPVKHPI
jgi:hypothetical protein